MIKIHLTEGQKKELGEKYWSQIKHRTRILSAFKTGKYQFEIANYSCNLYHFLYKDNNFNEQNLKELVLADRGQMMDYINKFQSTSSEKNSDILVKMLFKYHRVNHIVAEIISELDVNVCPYCNMQYTTILKRKHISASKKDNIIYKLTLDHYYPKSKYPFLALSIWNLIPCCHNCNLAKSNHDTYKFPILYPYEDEFGYDIVFSAKPNKNSDFVKFICGLESDFNIIIENLKGQLPDSVHRQLDMFDLEELYASHKHYVQNILKKTYIYSDDYIRNLCNQFPDILGTKDKTMQIIYMTDMDKDSWSNHILGKLTRDIIWDRFDL